MIIPILFFHRGKRLFANIITMAPYSEGGVDWYLQVASVNVYYLIANDTVDDIIWYVCVPLDACKEFVSSCEQLLCFHFVLIFNFLLQGCCPEQVGKFGPGYLFLSFSFDLLTWTPMCYCWAWEFKPDASKLGLSMGWARMGAVLTKPSP